jgi:hypothetical protein
MLSQSDLDNFHLFATNEIAHGGQDVSLQELLRRWLAQQVDGDCVESIGRGMADAEVGRMRSLAHVDAKIQTELGLCARRQ